jgi:hypothetical protein
MMLFELTSGNVQIQISYCLRKVPATSLQVMQLMQTPLYLEA